MAGLACIGCNPWQRQANHHRATRRHAPSATGALIVMLLTMVMFLHSAGAGVVRLAKGQSLSPVSQASPSAYALEAASGLAEGAGAADGWWLDQIGVPEAWARLAGCGEAVVAVVDAGIDGSHPDLADQLWVNPGEIPDNRLDDDDNGYVDDIHGWNMVDENADLSDSTGHGTAMAGIIAGAQNDVGITGVCPQCRLMVIKVTGADGQAQYAHIAAGIRYAASNGADVINISLRGRINSSTLWQAVAEAAQEAVLVSGAGNDGGTKPVYPGAYDQVLAVAATGRNDTRLGISNHGGWVDVAAPGTEIRTSRSSGGYWSRSGTSVAAAMVSGLAGLLQCQHPDWSPEQVRARIVQTADCIEEMNPDLQNQLGSGRINADRASGTFSRSVQPSPGATTNARILSADRVQTRPSRYRFALRKPHSRT